MNVALFTSAVIHQKLNYLTARPVRRALLFGEGRTVFFAEDYPHSSALFYEKKIDHFGIMQHYMG